ncbi:dethiobiotin synthase [Cesiribacter sp. SM1]|uniref:dethiobiotin synthase n=1 Tax=Cesiribacter sp. SM1 TaxID=2861196 RepID=UPI001CD24A9A|nr:dethiobiotin synthase [Cesiribacter sp. SM1]
MKRYFVTAIGTDSGKTVASAILCKALGADYWKPIQSGAPADADTVRELCPGVVVHPEAYRFSLPASPHAAARAEGKTIDPDAIRVPDTSNNLVIEGAGGCLVPLNDTHFIIDLQPRFEAPIVLVANLYLGSINHTLLTWRLLLERGYPVAGIIFNGPANPESEKIILHHTGYKKLLQLESHSSITPAIIDHYAQKLREQLG